jgi:hypothetical protein
MTILFALIAIIGIGLIIAGIKIKKKYRIAFIIPGALLAAAGTFMVTATLYFAWAVSNDAPAPDYYETEIESGELQDTGIIINH